MTTIEVDGCTLTPEKFHELTKKGTKIALTEAAWQHVRNSRAVIASILKKGQVVYGINTGFGHFAHVAIAEEKLEELQYNLIRSHSAGMGKRLSRKITKGIMALRINTLSKGHSGISEEALVTYIDAFNKNLIPVVPCQGSVGASGDLAPLAHLTLGLLGEGEMWDPETGEITSAAKVLAKHSFESIHLQPKDGLALINGTQFITAHLCEALLRAENAYRTAQCIAALTLEVLCGVHTAFMPSIHEARPHDGQIETARVILALHEYGEQPSIHTEKGSTKVQDAYSLRCIPQVHGIVGETLRFIRSVATIELNSATDNPMIFPGLRTPVMSGGNFHGEYPAKLADYLAIAVHELASLSVVRLERLMNPNTSGMPAFLVNDGGLNSGFMIAHCTAAALVSENKTLCHPASVDSIPTSAGQEDHVSMGAWAGRKALMVVKNVEKVLAIELQAACQALDLLRPLQATEPLEKLHALVRQHVPFYERDQMMAADMKKLTGLVKRELVWNELSAYVDCGEKKSHGAVAEASAAHCGGLSHDNSQ